MPKYRDSAFFKITPDIKRILACTRVTNKTVRLSYSLCDFTKDANPVLDHAFNLNHWVFLEYKVELSDTLQKTAASFVDVK